MEPIIQKLTDLDFSTIDVERVVEELERLRLSGMPPKKIISYLEKIKKPKSYRAKIVHYIPRPNYEIQEINNHSSFKTLGLYFAPGQKDKKSMFAEDFFKGLYSNSKRKILNADVLGYLLKHQDEIPEAWKQFQVMFLGTVFNTYKEEGIIFFLYFDKEKQIWSCNRMHKEQFYYPDTPAAIDLGHKREIK